VFNAESTYKVDEVIISKMSTKSKAK